MNALVPTPIEQIHQALAWVVVVSKSGQEVLAKEQLEAKGFEVYLPMRMYENRKGETCARPFLDNYLFAHVPLLVSEWKSIFSTRGVKGVLGVSGNRAYGLKDRVIQRIKDREDAGYIRLGLLEDQAPRRFGSGERVKVDDLLDGLFLEHVDARRALILVSLLGRDSEQVVDLKRLAATGQQ